MTSRSDLEPPAELLVLPLPRLWIGLQLDWLKGTTVEPIRLATFSIPHRDDGAERMHLYAARYDLKDVLVGGEHDPSGFFVEFIAFWRNGHGKWNSQRLSQQDGICFLDLADLGVVDSVPARAIRPASRYCLADAPRWVASGPEWPTYRGEPMLFVGQTPIGLAAGADLRFGNEDEVFVFHAFSGKGRHFCVLDQFAATQSPDEHYRFEAARLAASGAKSARSRGRRRRKPA